MHNTPSIQPLNFFVPVNWSAAPEQLSNCLPTYLQFAVNLLCRAAEFYTSRGKDTVFVEFNQRERRYEVNSCAEMTLRQQAYWSLFRGVTALSFVTAAGRLIFLGTGRICEESAARGLFSQMCDVCVSAGALTPVVLVAIKIAVRLRNEIVALPKKINLEQTNDCLKESSSFPRAQVCLEERAPSPLILEKSAHAQQIDEWLTEEANLSLKKRINEHCLWLKALENWEMLTYALALMEEKIADLNSSAQLLFVIQSSLQVLTEAIVRTFKFGHQPQMNICFRNGLLGSEMQPNVKVVERIAHLKSAIEKESSPSLNLKVIQNEIDVWQKALDLMCSYIMPQVLTCREEHYYSCEKKGAISQLTSHLFENKRVLSFFKGESEMYFFPISQTDCSCFLKSQELKEGFSVCRLEDLPADCQNEFEQIMKQLL